MKKQTNQRWQTVLLATIAIGILLGAYGSMVNQSQAQTKVPSGEYAFMSVASQRSDGSANVNTNVHGSLILKNNGTYEHDIYIGNSPGGCGPGTYSISGDTLTLTPKASTGCSAADWKYIYSAQMNRLSLRDENVTLLYCVAGGKDCFKN